jgi:hypothetical protein
MKNFAIVRSVDAPTHISTQDLCAFTERLISQLPQAGRLMPPILVMHVSESVAAIVGVGRTGVVRHNRSAACSELPSYYEIWLVGQAGMADYVLALQGIMDDFYVSALLRCLPDVQPSSQ